LLNDDVARQHDAESDFLTMGTPWDVKTCRLPLQGIDQHIVGPPKRPSTFSF
jgi:hypothetical protein